MAHAMLSPSGMPAAIRCLAKVRRERGLPEQSSSFADQGTAAHYLLEQCLLKGVDADHFKGCRIKVENGHAEFHTGGQFPVGSDMIPDLQKALDYIHAVADGATIYSEQKLSIVHITGEYWNKQTGAVAFRTDSGALIDIDSGQVYAENEVEPATGTTDIWIIKGRVAHCMDLKWGMGVQVFAQDNEQQEMYTDAGLKEFDYLDEVEELHLHILQPRMKHFDEAVYTRQQLADRIQAIRDAALRIATTPAEELTAVPGEKQCRFCKASATCKERTEHTLELIVGEFVDLDKGFVKVEMPQAEKLLAQSFGVKPAAITYHDAADDENEMHIDAHFTVKKPSIRPSLEAAIERVVDATDEKLATLMDAVELLESFPKAVRAEIERRALAGTWTDARYKLVEGRQGARAWTDEAEAEAAMKAMRLKTDEMYDRKVISPTSAEKLLGESNKRKWAKLQPLITRSDGKPSVAPASDKRPALTMAIAEQFEELPAEVETLLEAELAHADQAQDQLVEDTFDDLV